MPPGTTSPFHAETRHATGGGGDRTAGQQMRSAHCARPIAEGLCSRHGRAPQLRTTVKAHGAAEDVCAGPRPGEGHRRPFFGGRTGGLAIRHAGN